ncbi:hypothetical protein [Calothrix sp. NIES-3974]|uniref:hypothetical protein n=1 Tax=Calothrix sp. NIES-3974 TaxID=2005462 RepID=UPI000B620875|nr:hypothetical protein [Calothrix sp. NIES-3974]BAZ05823.1 hypothetical protein NIES3974_24780 [Calothrix sp. NIES-3974]
MVFKIWQTINYFVAQFNQINSQNTLVVAGGVHLNSSHFNNRSASHNCEIASPRRNDKNPHFDYGRHWGISYTHKFQQSITNNLSIGEARSDGDDFDTNIDAIFVPEPIDQPTPVEPVGQSDDD